MITAIHHPDTALHVPSAEIWVGVPITGTEVPERVDRITEALAAAGIPGVIPPLVDPAALHTIHDPAMVRFLEAAWERWQASPYPSDPGQNRVVPYAFPLSQMTSGRAPRKPATIGAETGMWAMDTMTLIGPGSWEAILAAASCAIAAADLVVETGDAAYALARPPGHHAGRDFYGGSCYVNNAALAAEHLIRAGAGRVAVVDVDAHHGNGTQELFYHRADVFYGSLHVDPGRGWFPHFVGYADEEGVGPGEGHNLNLCLEPGSGDEPWLESVRTLAARAADCDALVISLGVDASADDPESPLQVSQDGYREAGRLLGALGRPTVAVQEGGYHLETLGSLVVAFLEGLSSA